MTDVKQLITEHLDIWLTAETEKKSGRGRSSGSSDTIYGVQKLRELILDLAIRGKLNKKTNHQAIELLDAIKEIQKEKNIKLKNGGISNNPNYIDFPSNWALVQIKTLGNVKGGKRIPKGKSFTEEVTPYIYLRVTDMKNQTIIDNDLKYINEDTFNEISRYTISKDDVYVTIAGTIGAVGSVPEKFHNMSLTENAAKITDLNLINQNWFIKVLSSKFVQNQFSEAVNQMAQPKLAINKVEDTFIPLPPLEEQCEIARKVDELMQLCDQLEQKQTLSSDAHATLVNSLLKALTESNDADEFQANWQRIVANFDVLFTTEYSIEQLKQTVLQLAVMGKLVKQDPSDEPASELLKKIADEKAKLIKEGKIKKSKPLPEITEDEKPFELPSGWEWTLLDFLAEDIHYGYTASANANIKDIRLLRISDIQDNKVDWDKVPGCEISEEIARNYLLKNGDILIARTGGTIGKSYLVENISIKSVFASYLIRVKRLESTYPAYMKLYFGSEIYWKQLYAASMGTGQPNVNGTSLKSLRIPLPPLNEQKRIVEKVNQLFSIIEQLQVLQSKLQKTKLYLADALVANAVEGV
ncbi:restriction endonuclease subunit S [Acinetobacter indicus]|uniref:restriction endonuclease subunit S n=1 Tax=Acinetobacter indicus TaxID=756892 RepID=UPI002578DF9F|nr:restriction endonuclease subunit S [Acinetobacter indicus]MDM1287061.1 restriction endonuclease subunit S [Acinetobacter indicus]